MNWLEEALKLQRDQWPNGHVEWIAKVHDPHAVKGYAVQGVYLKSTNQTNSVRLFCTRRTDWPEEKNKAMDIWVLNQDRSGWGLNAALEYEYKKWSEVNKANLLNIIKLLKQQDPHCIFCGLEALEDVTTDSGNPLCAACYDAYEAGKADGIGSVQG